MRILITLTNSTGKNIAFITDDLVVRTLDQVVALALQGKIQGVHAVSGSAGPYVRSDHNDTTQDNLDSLSMLASSFLQDLKEGATSEAARLYLGLKEAAIGVGDDVIRIDGRVRCTKSDVQSRLKPLAAAITQAAKDFNIDRLALGAVLIDEYVRSGLDDIGDVLGGLGLVDTSVGLAQVKVSTARDLIAKGYYKGLTSSVSDSELYNLLNEDESSVRFAAAVLSMHVDLWKQHIDLKTQPEILVSLYSLGIKTAHSQPRPSERGRQIIREFLPLARELLVD